MLIHSCLTQHHSQLGPSWEEVMVFQKSFFSEALPSDKISKLCLVLLNTTSRGKKAQCVPIVASSETSHGWLLLGSWMSRCLSWLSSSNTEV